MADEPTGAAPAATEEPAGVSPESGGAPAVEAAETAEGTEVDISDLIREELEIQTKPLTDKVNALTTENVVLQTRLNDALARGGAPAGGEPNDDLDDDEKINTAIRTPGANVAKIIREIADRRAREHAGAAAGEVREATQLTSTLEAEKQQVFREIPELNPDHADFNSDLINRANTIYKAKLGNGDFRPGIIRDSANQAYLEFVRSGKLAPPKPKTPATPVREVARRAATRVTLTPERTPQSSDATVEAEMAKEFTQEELNIIKQNCAKSGGAVTLSKYWKNYKSKQAEDSSFGYVRRA